jgi:hypothetical protein
VWAEEHARNERARTYGSDLERQAI